MRALRPALLCLALLAFSAGAAAEELKTQAGDLTVPEGFVLLDRNEEPAKDGSPSGLYVYAREADALPRAIYILTFAKPHPAPGETLTDTANAAALMANPMAPKPDLRKSKPTTIGGAPGHRHATTLPNGLLSTAYAVDHNGLRLVALLKHPPGRDYKRDTARFEEALQAFRWTAATATPAADPQATEAAAPAAADGANGADAADAAENAEAAKPADPADAADVADAESAAPPVQHD
jgi:hypothetical protein